MAKIWQRHNHEGVVVLLSDVKNQRIVPDENGNLHLTIFLFILVVTRPYEKDPIYAFRLHDLALARQTMPWRARPRLLDKISGQIKRHTSSA